MVRFGVLWLDGALRRGGALAQVSSLLGCRATLSRMCGYRRKQNRQASSGESGVEPHALHVLIRKITIDDRAEYNLPALLFVQLGVQPIGYAAIKKHPVLASSPK